MEPANPSNIWPNTTAMAPSIKASKRLTAMKVKASTITPAQIKYVKPNGMLNPTSFLEIVYAISNPSPKISPGSKAPLLTSVPS